jgi:uncharacterized UPF0146 family protein
MPADEQGPKRRARIYAERWIFSLRSAPELHKRMIALCDNFQTPTNTNTNTNTYISTLIENDLKKRNR